MVFYVLHAVITRLHLHLYGQDFCIRIPLLIFYCVVRLPIGQRVWLPLSHFVLSSITVGDRYSTWRRIELDQPNAKIIQDSA